MNKFIILLIFLTFGCGYQPIYVNKDLNKFTFNTISLNGNKQINRKIISMISVNEDKLSNLQKNLIINSNLNIVETSKDSKGKVTSYRTNVKVILTITDKNEVIKNKTFTQDFSYNNRDNKFELVEYQKEILNNITQQISEEIIIFLNL